ncbi:MAG: hypothetical protein IT165_06635 [Bryobacterales bacterium]|nr:hypothetical protein [Bryobacterales bacterium]
MEIRERLEQPALFDFMPARRFRRTWRRVPSRWPTAVHESGHAVVALWYRIPFDVVTIRPSMGMVSGHLRLIPDSWIPHAGQTPAELAAKLCVVIAAGFAAVEHRGFAARVPGLDARYERFEETSDYEHMMKIAGMGDEPLEKQEQLATNALSGAHRLFEFPLMQSALLLLASELEMRITVEHRQAVSIAEGIWRR